MRRLLLLAAILGAGLAGLLVGGVFRGHVATSLPSLEPPVRASPSASTGTVVPTPDPALARPTVLLASMVVDALYDQPSAAEARRWVAAAVRSERWRFDALTAGDGALEQTLLSDGGVDDEYGGYFAANATTGGELAGPPTYLEGLAVKLTPTDQAALVRAGGNAAATQAVILIEKGPLTMTTANHAVDTFADASGRELILVGGLVDDGALGEIWRSSLIIGCPPADSVSIETCTG